MIISDNFLFFRWLWHPVTSSKCLLLNWTNLTVVWRQLLKNTIVSETSEWTAWAIRTMANHGPLRHQIKSDIENVPKSTMWKRQWIYNWWVSKVLQYICKVLSILISRVNMQGQNVWLNLSKPEPLNWYFGSTHMKCHTMRVCTDC